MLFLGTSSGTPTRARNVSALALLEATGKGWHLIDCGEGCQHQLLHTPLSLHDLRAIFITHVHGDHCYGLPGLLASAGMTRRHEPLDIIAPQGIEAWLRATFAMSHSWLGYELRFHAVETFDQWRNPHLRVEATALSHRVPCYGYTFTEARPDPSLNIQRLERDGIPRGPLWGQLARGFDVELGGRTLRSEDYLTFGRAPRRIVIGGDNDRPDLLAQACQGAQVLVHEATYTEAVVNATGNHFGHSTAAQVAAFAQQAGVPNLLLTHFSPRYQPGPQRGHSIDDVHREASEKYSGHLYLAEDFSRFHLNKNGVLVPVASTSNRSGSSHGAQEN
nr:ribonuclease Z [Stutzerimonas sp. S1]